MRKTTGISVTKQLINVNAVSLNFNLREPKGNKATNVYAVIRLGSIQLKLPTKCKVNSWQWDKKKQMPIVVGDITETDYFNNLKVYSTLSLVRLDILKYYSYLCTGSENVTVKELKDSIREIVLSRLKDEDMNDDNLSKSVVRTPKASTLLIKAFDLYYGTYHKSTKEVSKSIEKSKLDAFIAYCDENGLNKTSSLSQKGLNKYQQYLLARSKELGSKGDSNKNINVKCQAIARMINFMVGNDNFSRYKLSKVEYQALEEYHAKGGDKKRRPLTNEELEKLMSCDTLNDREKEYRDLFILECNAGYRVSDTPKLFNPSLQRFHSKDGNEYLTIVPQKEEAKNIIAVIWLNETVKTILERYKDGFKYADVNKTHYSRNLIYNLRNIFKKASLDSTEKWIDAKGNQHEDKLYDIVGSHFARYTFIYHGLFDYGFTPDELKDFTGHADDTMINDVYKVYSEEDVVTVADKALNRVMAKVGSSTSPTQQITAVINPLNDLFAYDSFISIIELMNSNNDVFHLDSTKQAIKIMKDISKLNSYSKDVDVSKVTELEQVIFELSYYFHDTLLYSVFKHKEHYFGMEVNVPSTEEVEIMFAQEDIERPKKQKQAELEDWENRYK